MTYGRGAKNRCMGWEISLGENAQSTAKEPEAGGVTRGGAGQAQKKHHGAFQTHTSDQAPTQSNLI